MDDEPWDEQTVSKWKINALEMRHGVDLNESPITQMHIINSPGESNYNSLVSKSGGNLNEMFLLCFLMTPWLLRLVENKTKTLIPFIYKLIPGKRMAAQFVEHYIFEYLEPVSKNEVGSYDLFDIIEVKRGK